MTSRSLPELPARWVRWSTDRKTVSPQGACSGSAAPYIARHCRYGGRHVARELCGRPGKAIAFGRQHGFCGVFTGRIRCRNPPQLQRAAHFFSEQLDSESRTSIMRLTVLDKPRLARLLDELDELMRANNMRATNVFDELRFTCGMALGDRLADLERAINDLDFPLSLEKTRSLRESVK